jgi:hypothetical protein
MLVMPYHIYTYRNMPILYREIPQQQLKHSQVLEATDLLQVYL